MAAEDVASALIAMRDADVRRRVRTGDLSALGDLDLTTEERVLVHGATIDGPREDQVLVPLGVGDVEAHGPLESGENALYFQPGMARAIEYVQENVRDPEMQARVVEWQDPWGDRHP